MFHKEMVFITLANELELREVLLPLVVLIDKDNPDVSKYIDLINSDTGVEIEGQWWVNGRLFNYISFGLTTSGYMMMFSGEVENPGPVPTPPVH